MKLALISLLGISAALAQDAPARASIEHTIALLNQVSARAKLFTADASSDLARLPEGGTAALVTISPQPWGEATVVVAPPGGEMVNPRISIGEIRFVTADVATVDGSWTRRDAGR